ncbi:unnamed protein product [Cunninghamella echinulata]
MEIITNQKIYVKPENTPLTQFCTQVSGVTSEMISSAGTLEEAIQTLHTAITTEIIDQQLDFCFVTHGGWVLRIQLPREARDKKLELPDYLSQPRMFDLKQEIQRWQVHHPEVHLRTTSLKELCTIFRLDIVNEDTTTVSTAPAPAPASATTTIAGKDETENNEANNNENSVKNNENNNDTSNNNNNNNNTSTTSTTTTAIAANSDKKNKFKPGSINIPSTTINVIRHLTKSRHNDVFVHPIDTGADLEQFKKEESKVIHLAGLPYEVTQGELEAWFSSNSLRPSTMWMMQSNDQTKPSLSGFIVFLQHSDAVKALHLNGRCLSDRVIEVSPSSDRVVEAAQSMLSPFPLQSKTRQVRPGDWNCPNCGFHNFASRRHCFKCNAENLSAPTPSSTPGTPLANGHSTSTPLSISASGSGGGPPHTFSPSTSHHGSSSAHHSPSPFTPGDWMCPNTNCSFHNYSSRAQCLKCGSYRPPSHGSSPHHHPPPPRPHHYHAPPPHSHHHSHHHGPPPPSSTSSSSSPHPPGGFNPHHYPPPRPHHPSSIRPGDWFCPNPACGFQNFASRMSCYKCHTPNPNPLPPMSQPPYPPPPSPHGGPPSHLGYGYDSYGGPGSAGGPPPPPYGYGNLPPGNTPAPGTGGHGFRAGDWYCPKCSSHNFASRFHCLKCHTAKPNTASQTPPPVPAYPGGGYHPNASLKSGDWVCRNNGCNFLNFAKRSYCGKCNAPNPTAPESNSFVASEY